MSRSRSTRRKQRDSLAQSIQADARYQFLTHRDNSRDWPSKYSSQWTKENDVPLGYGTSWINPRMMLATATR